MPNLHLLNADKESCAPNSYLSSAEREFAAPNLHLLSAGKESCAPNSYLLSAGREFGVPNSYLLNAGKESCAPNSCLSSAGKEFVAPNSCLSVAGKEFGTPNSCLLSAGKKFVVQNLCLSDDKSLSATALRGLGAAAPSGAGEGGWFGGRKPPLPSRGDSSLQDVLSASKRKIILPCTEKAAVARRRMPAPCAGARRMYMREKSPSARRAATGAALRARLVTL